mgnify:CR=1 FL=1
MRFSIYLLLFIGNLAIGQTITSNEFSYNEFLGYVKKYHPLVKIADLNISEAQANLIMARGGFDPKLEADFDQKKYSDTDYYSIFSSSFKIPTWYGIELKAGFDNNDGYYLNPQNTVPSQGLTSVGIAIPIGQGLLINQRMADVSKAKIQLKLSTAERQLEAISVLYDASLAYFNWKKNYEEVQLYKNYLTNASIRFEGIKKSIEFGDKPAIDSVEAGIVIRNRELSLEDSQLKLNKAKLELSNFLWLENNIPLEIQDGLIPEENLENTITETLQTNDLLQNTSIENHPKINAWQAKIEMLTVDKKLKANMLLPKIDIGYSYLFEPNYFNESNFEDYKIGVNFSYPLFLRKERGSLKLAKFKVQDAEYNLNLEKLQLSNKISAQKIEINSLTKQTNIIENLVKDYQTMLRSEEKLFSFGESSMFLINTRENNLVSSQLSKINVTNRFFVSNAELFKILANQN